MVATDIAARGIDISDLAHVINYSLPEDPAVYLHRVGRTGRIGKKGIAHQPGLRARARRRSPRWRRSTASTSRSGRCRRPKRRCTLWTERHVREIEGGLGRLHLRGLPCRWRRSSRRAPDADDLIAFLLKYFFSHLRMEKAQAAAGDGEASSRWSRASPSAGARTASAGARATRRAREGAHGAQRASGRRDGAPGPRAPPRRDEPRPRGPGRARGRPAARRLEAGPGEVKLWVNLGTADGLGPGSIATAMEDAGAPVGKMVRAELRPDVRLRLRRGGGLGGLRGPQRQAARHQDAARGEEQAAQRARHHQPRPPRPRTRAPAR